MPKHDSGPKVQIAARIPPEQVARLDKIAQRLRVDRSTVVRWLIEDAPDDYAPPQFRQPKRR